MADGFTTALDEASRPLCLMCSAAGRMSEREPHGAAARSDGLIESYRCPDGWGWHLRVPRRRSTAADSWGRVDNSHTYR